MIRKAWSRKVLLKAHWIGPKRSHEKDLNTTLLSNAETWFDNNPEGKSSMQDSLGQGVIAQGQVKVSSSSPYFYLPGDR